MACRSRVWSECPGSAPTRSSAGSASRLVLYGVDGGVAAFLLLSPPGHRSVVGDSEQPGIERRVSAERTEFAKRKDERVLRHIPGLLEGAQKVHERAVQAILMPRDKVAERFGVPVPTTADQYKVRCVHVF